MNIASLLCLPDASPEVRAAEQQYLAVFERHRKSEFFVLSLPKSGRTWHRTIVGCYLARIVGEPAHEALKLVPLCRKAKISRIGYSHNGVSPSNILTADHPMVASPLLWQGKPVLLLVRNPKDILVSAYYHARYRTGTFTRSLPEFIRDRRTGIELIMTAYRRWYENRHLASQFDVISYEEMHRNPEQVLRKTLHAVGLTPIEEAVREAVAFCSFERMREYENTNFFNSNRMRKQGQDPRGHKVREGVVGGSQKYLTAEDITFIEQCIHDGGDPFGHCY